MTRVLRAGCALALCVAAGSVAADDDPLGRARLADALGAAQPSGRGVVVAQVETPSRIAGDDEHSSRRTFAPDRRHPDLAHVRFVANSPVPAWGGRHATEVARQFYGRSASLAPAIDTVHLYESRDFLRRLARAARDAKALAPARVWNHSWVGGGDIPVGVVLRQLDAAAAREQWVVIAGVNNAGANQPLLSSAFNILSVGRSDGGHRHGAARVDRVYDGNRARPHLVAPAKNTSSAVAIVASAAAALIETGRRGGLSRDPQHNSVATRTASVANAERAITVRAALMAGAQRNLTPPAGQSGWRGDPSVRTDNGLDTRFGAGQLNLYNSYAIVAAGEFNHTQDAADAPPLPPCGFDVDPQFGGEAQSNRRSTYLIEPSEEREWSFALVWPVRPAGVTIVDDLDLTLSEVSEARREIAASRATRASSEHLQARLLAGRKYVLEVRTKRTADFVTPYALAWYASPAN